MPKTVGKATCYTPSNYTQRWYLQHGLAARHLDGSDGYPVDLA